MKRSLLLAFVITLFISNISKCFSNSEDVIESKSSWKSPVIDTETYGFLLFDLLEYQKAGREDSLKWDILGWRGGDTNRVWIKSEGSNSISSSTEGAADLQLLYGKLLTKFFDLQIGPRLEQVWTKEKSISRMTGVLGIQGLALYLFELEAALFVGAKGHFAGRLTATKDYLFTQRAIAQLRFETNASAERSDAFQTGAGINDLSLGLRFRYEFKREMAPYLGISRTNLNGKSAEYRKQAGGEISEWTMVGGIRMWF